MEVVVDEPGPSSALLIQDEPIVAPTELTSPHGRSPFSHPPSYEVGLYQAWRKHWFTFAVWLILSIAAVIMLPFSDTLDTGEALFISLGAWMGIIASGLYFVPIPIKNNPNRIKRLAFFIIMFSIFAFVIDFPVAVTCIWSIRSEQDKEDSEDDDVILGVSAGVLFLGGCFSIVAFAKCMIIGTYEAPKQSFKRGQCFN